MARYIDAEKLIYQLRQNQMWTKSRDLTEAIITVQNQPTADVVEVKQIEIIRDDLKWWLETNTEKGVVYIPKFVVENMIAKMDGGKTE